MLPDQVSNPGPLTYESGALPIALRGPAAALRKLLCVHVQESGIVQWQRTCIVFGHIALQPLISNSVLQVYNNK